MKVAIDWHCLMAEQLAGLVDSHERPELYGTVLRFLEQRAQL